MSRKPNEYIVILQDEDGEEVERFTVHSYTMQLALDVSAARLRGSNDNANRHNLPRKPRVVSAEINRVEPVAVLRKDDQT